MTNRGAPADAEPCKRNQKVQVVSLEFLLNIVLSFPSALTKFKITEIDNEVKLLNIALFPKFAYPFDPLNVTPLPRIFCVHELAVIPLKLPIPLLATSLRLVPPPSKKGTENIKFFVIELPKF